MRIISIILALGLLACGGEPPSNGENVDVPVKKPVDTRPMFRGTVLEKVGEKPIADATVVVRLAYGAGKAGHDGLTTTTDSDGEFAVDIEGKLKPRTDSPVLLEVAKPGYVKRQWEVPSFAPGQGRSVMCWLMKAGTVTGEVRDTEDRPVADAIVYAIRPDLLGVRTVVEVIHARTGADGGFRLPGLPGGKLDIGAKAKGLQFEIVEDVRVTPGEETPVSAIVLRPGKTIAGRAVLKGDKVPVTRGVVRIWRDPSVKDFVLYGRGGVSRGGGVARLDKEGRFSVSGLADGKYDVDVVTLGLVGAPGGADGVEPGRTDLELVFQKAARVVLRVVDGKTNEKIPRFSLVIQSITGPKDANRDPVVKEEIDVRSPVGQYSFPAREDEIYGIEILVEGYEIERLTVGPLKGGAPEVTNVHLKRRE